MRGDSFSGRIFLSLAGLLLLFLVAAAIFGEINLRRVLGTTAMTNLMRSYAQSHRYGVSTVRDFKAAAQQAAGYGMTNLHLAIDNIAATKQHAARHGTFAFIAVPPICL